MSLPPSFPLGGVPLPELPVETPTTGGVGVAGGLEGSVVVVVLVGVVVTGALLGAAASAVVAWLVDAVFRTCTLERCDVFASVADRLGDALMADEGATDVGRLLMTMPVARPSVKTPVTTHEMIARN